MPPIPVYLSFQFSLKLVLKFLSTHFGAGVRISLTTFKHRQVLMILFVDIALMFYFIGILPPRSWCFVLQNSPCIGGGSVLGVSSFPQMASSQIPFTR